MDAFFSSGHQQHRADCRDGLRYKWRCFALPTESNGRWTDAHAHADIGADSVPNTDTFSHANPIPFADPFGDTNAYGHAGAHADPKAESDA